MAKQLTALGTYLERARGRRGMTVTEVMKEADLSRSTWYSLIEGRADHRAETVRSVAGVLRVDVEYALRLAFDDGVPAGRELATLSENEIVEMISAGVRELQRRAERATPAHAPALERTPALTVA